MRGMLVQPFWRLQTTAKNEPERLKTRNQEEEQIDFAPAQVPRGKAAKGWLKRGRELGTCRKCRPIPANGKQAKVCVMWARADNLVEYPLKFSGHCGSVNHAGALVKPYQSLQADGAQLTRAPAIAVTALQSL